jgi:SAM-dependent methyltransferase
MNGYQSFAGFYDALMQEADSEGRALFYDRLIKEHSLIEARTLLDLASGTGNLTFIFARLGYDITAVDISEEMLLRAFEKKLALDDRNVLLLCQDMTELEQYFKYIDHVQYRRDLDVELDLWGRTDLVDTHLSKLQRKSIKTLSDLISKEYI